MDRKLSQLLKPELCIPRSTFGVSHGSKKGPVGSLVRRSVGFLYHYISLSRVRRHTFSLPPSHQYVFLFQLNSLSSPIAIIR